MTRHTRRGVRLIAAGAAFTLLIAACGDDDDGEAATTTAAEEETTTTGGDGDGEHAELCALAEEFFNQEDFPTAEQVRRYQELAPEEIADATELAGAAIIDNEDDPVAMFAAFAEDDVEAAIEEINAFETSECGIEHEPVVAEQEAEAGAAVVDVAAVEYDFLFDQPVTAGRTSFRLTNDGGEAHFMIVGRIGEGHTLQEALEFEGDPEEEGIIVPDSGGESGLAAPGGEDEEFLTVDLEAGTYGMVCFVPSPDGTPHAFLGMAKEFTVS